MKRLGPPGWVVLQGNVPARAPGAPKVTRTHVYWVTVLSLNRPAEAPLLIGLVSGAPCLVAGEAVLWLGQGTLTRNLSGGQDSLLGPPPSKHAKACIAQAPL